LVPKAAVVAFLVNPNNPNLETLLRETHAGARALNLELHVVQASNESEINTAFASAVEERIGALLVGSDPLFGNQNKQIVALAAGYGIATIYPLSEFAMAGGLMSYGASLSDAARLAGLYAGRIINGEKPADLPVQQSTKVELTVNLKTAKALGLTFPLALLGRADNVIE
jgi:putative tryptophan/tyrosine transport system substrate-binding protein